MIEICWHGRAGQGAKTVSELLAATELRRGHFVQAFPEYGPERGGAPVRAYTRIDDRPIRRRYPVTEAEVVVVLDPSLLADVDVASGAAAEALVLVNAATAPTIRGCDDVHAIDAGTLAKARHANMVMLGALAAGLGAPSPEELCAAADEMLAAKLAPRALEEARAAMLAGAAAMTSTVVT
jgi:pyruvate ferredoxin oxidoreductase gamma subunit